MSDGDEGLIRLNYELSLTISAQESLNVSRELIKKKKKERLSGTFPTETKLRDMIEQSSFKEKAGCL